MGRPPCVPMYRDPFFYYGVLHLLGLLLLLRYLGVL